MKHALFACYLIVFTLSLMIRTSSCLTSQSIYNKVVFTLTLQDGKHWRKLWPQCSLDLNPCAVYLRHVTGWSMY